MKLKRLLLMVLLLLCVCAFASATLASLDEALSPLISGRGAVSLCATLTLETLQPFDQTRIDLFNRVLSHARLNARFDLGQDVETTDLSLLLGARTLFTLSEQNRGGAYLLQTSLLPNRRVLSTQASPIGALAAPAPGEPEPEEITQGLNASPVDGAFDMLATARELKSCYRDLAEGIIPLTEQKSANYTIKGIGKGRISYVAKLTAEQCEALLPQLRAVVSCGMDAEYRAELAQATFASGLTAALYQNADGEDICLYLKGTLIYPDGDRRALKWQWAFTPGWETQSYSMEAARESGTRDSRTVNASLAQKKEGETLSLEGETTVTLRRSSLVETSVFTLSLKAGSGSPVPIGGEINRVTTTARGGETTGKTEETVAVDLALAPVTDGLELTGTAAYARETDKRAQLRLLLTFLPSAAQASEQPAQDAQEQPTPAVEISIIPAEPAAAQETQSPQAQTAATPAPQSAYLVGSPPLGLNDYEVPVEITTVNLDGEGQETLQTLMAEAAQRLAGNLILAILDLPAEDRALLSDGMTPEDYAVFLAILQ